MGEIFGGLILCAVIFFAVVAIVLAVVVLGFGGRWYWRRGYRWSGPRVVNEKAGMTRPRAKP